MLALPVLVLTSGHCISTWLVFVSFLKPQVMGGRWHFSNWNIEKCFVLRSVVHWRSQNHHPSARKDQNPNASGHSLVALLCPFLILFLVKILSSSCQRATCQYLDIFWYLAKDLIALANKNALVQARAKEQFRVDPPQRIAVSVQLSKCSDHRGMRTIGALPLLSHWLLHSDLHCNENVWNSSTCLVVMQHAWSSRLAIRRSLMITVFPCSSSFFDLGEDQIHLGAFSENKSSS